MCVCVWTGNVCTYTYVGRTTASAVMQHWGPAGSLPVQTSFSQGCGDHRGTKLPTTPPLPLYHHRIITSHVCRGIQMWRSKGGAGRFYCGFVWIFCSQTRIINKDDAFTDTLKSRKVDNLGIMLHSFLAQCCMSFRGWHYGKHDTDLFPDDTDIYLLLMSNTDKITEMLTFTQFKVHIL